MWVLIEIKDNSWKTKSQDRKLFHLAENCFFWLMLESTYCLQFITATLLSTILHQGSHLYAWPLRHLACIPRNRFPTGHTFSSLGLFLWNTWVVNRRVKFHGYGFTKHCLSFKPGFFISWPWTRDSKFLSFSFCNFKMKMEITLISNS